VGTFETPLLRLGGALCAFANGRVSESVSGRLPGVGTRHSDSEFVSGASIKNCELGGARVPLVEETEPECVAARMVL
jgi:hypothetical protein